jgi:hypothetical protein
MRSRSGWTPSLYLRGSTWMLVIHPRSAADAPRHPPFHLAARSLELEVRQPREAAPRATLMTYEGPVGHVLNSGSPPRSQCTGRTSDTAADVRASCSRTRQSAHLPPSRRLRRESLGMARTSGTAANPALWGYNLQNPGSVRKDNLAYQRSSNPLPKQTRPVGIAI